MSSKISVFLLLLSCAVSTTPTFAQDWLIKSVAVFNVDSGEFSQPKDLLIKDGVIAHIGKVTSDEKLVVIDGKGKYLVPGFTEMHAHVSPTPVSEQRRDNLLFLYNAYGITTIRSMLGHPWHLRLREQLNNNEVAGPRLITSGPSFNGNSVANIEQAVGRVDAQKERGYDFIKVHPGMTDAEYRAMAARANELSFDYSGHVTAETGVLESVAIGQGTIDHLDGVFAELVKRSGKEFDNAGFFGSNIANLVDEKQIAPLAQELAKSGVAMVPTESLMTGFLSPDNPEEIAKDDLFQLMPKSTVNGWINTRKNIQGDPSYSVASIIRFVELRLQFLKAFHEAGGLILLGSDAPQVFNVPGDSIHYEMELMVQAGMTPAEVLQAASIKPAEFFKQQESWGSLTVEQSADMVLLDANPLENIKNTRLIAGVMTRGNWLSKEDIEAGLEKIRAFNAQ